MGRLINLTLIATIGVALVLLGYASWLSIRIRTLSEAAELALDEKKLKMALPSALAGDEVGDLSRSFSSVLRQLGIYNDYLQSLASKLSHELRTPLNAIMGFSQLLVAQTGGPLSTKQQEQVNRIYTNGEMLLELINDLFLSVRV